MFWDGGYWRRVGSVVGLAAIVGCGKAQGNNNPSAGRVISSAGGEVQIDGVDLIVPAGALDASQTITITTTQSSPPAGYVADSPIYRFEPEGLTFAKPVTVSITFHGDASRAGMYWTALGSSRFEPHPGVVTPDAVTALVTHFSLGFVGEPASSTDAGLDGISANGGQGGFAGAGGLGGTSGAGALTGSGGSNATGGAGGVTVSGGTGGTEITGGTGGTGGTGTGGIGGTGGSTSGTCGNGSLDSGEACDDGNTVVGDGCANCQVETGWVCPPGLFCHPRCGDGLILGSEQCDDGGVSSYDGCSNVCRVEAGWICPSGVGCRKTVCGDGVTEGSESCDDGDILPGDNCSPSCTVEPVCNGAACVSTCGDGIVAGVEQCDDGNTTNGDGCSSACALEAGYTCSTPAPLSVSQPIVLRDFISLPAGSEGIRHPDFEFFNETANITEGLVGASLDAVELKPTYTGICESNNLVGPCPAGAQTMGKPYFDQWYRDTNLVSYRIIGGLPLTLQSDGSYAFTGAPYFPVDRIGWIQAGHETDSYTHNVGFTSEARLWFQFQGGEQLTFASDDDEWVFINRKLALDLGGSHTRVERTIVLDGATGAAHCFVDRNLTTACSTPSRSLGIQPGQLYELGIFYAERHSTSADFEVRLNGVVSAPSVCTPVCGDGVVTGSEACDLGAQNNTGAYGKCNFDCSLPAYCGDGSVNGPGEECDAGYLNGTLSSLCTAICTKR